CVYGTGSWGTCTGNQDARHIFSKLSDGTTIGVNHTAPVVAPPAADYATWYDNAIPGPSQSCTTSSGTLPTFDGNYPSRDNSVSTVFDLTPSSSYFCRVGNGAHTTLTSAITSSATTLTVSSATGFPTTQFNIRIDNEFLTVSGTIYIDGSAKISNCALNSYDGQATLYLSGTFRVTGSLCASISGTDCDFSTWNPDFDMI